MTTDTVEPLVAADFKAGVRGTDKPPGSRFGHGAPVHRCRPAIGFVVFFLWPTCAAST